MWRNGTGWNGMGWVACDVVVIRCRWLWGRVTWCNAVVWCGELEDAALLTKESPRHSSLPQSTTPSFNYGIPLLNLSNSELILSWTFPFLIPLLNFAFIKLFLYWTAPLLSKSFTELVLHWTVPFLNCSFSERFICETVPFLNQFFTELFLY